MLASITPLGERGRHSRWGLTVAAFLIGSTAAGLALGWLTGMAGAALLPDLLGVRPRLAVLGVAALLAALLDAVPQRVPGPRRQVDERWLDRFRGWVYGAGYGVQLGVGVGTVVSSAATYVALLAAFLSADGGRGALILVCFGAVRGLSLLAGARVRRPEQLRDLHARLTRWRTPAARAGALALAGLALTVLALAWSPG